MWLTNCQRREATRQDLTLSQPLRYGSVYGRMAVWRIVRDINRIRCSMSVAFLLTGLCLFSCICGENAAEGVRLSKLKSSFEKYLLFEAPTVRFLCLC